MNASAETIARAFGLHRAGREYTGKCPSCGYKTGFAVADRKGSLPLVYCHAGGCSQQDLIEALRRAGLWPDERNREKPHERSRPKAKVRAAAHAPPDPDDPSPDPHAEAALAIWRRAVSAAGSPAETYLRFRGYTGPIPPSLRFARGKHPSDGRYHPMMVGAVVLGGDMSSGVQKLLTPRLPRTSRGDWSSGLEAMTPIRVNCSKLRRSGRGCRCWIGSSRTGSTLWILVLAPRSRLSPFRCVDTTKFRAESW